MLFEVYFFSESELEKMSLIIGYNASDVTYGWNGRMSGFTLHYSHFTVGYRFKDFSLKIKLNYRYPIIDIVEEHGHAFPLSPGLIPIVYFQNVEKVFLGRPFTTCIETSAINSYAKWVRIS